MSQRSNRSASRRRATFVAGAVLAALALAGAPPAGATPNATDLEATVLRIGGAPIAVTTPVPAGRTLTPVHLTTSDPNTTDGDGYGLSSASAGVRTKRFTIPGQPAEAATFRINGSVVATSVPDIRRTQLQTDAGPLQVLVFTASGATYAIPLSDIGAATRTTATSTTSPSTINATYTYQYGLLPVGAQTFVGSAFRQSATYGVPSGPGAVDRVSVVDADDIRRNADTAAEELVVLGEPAPRYDRLLGSTGDEVIAIVTLRSGTTLSVRALRFSVFGAYGAGNATWLFDRTALAAAGATIADVTGVVAQVATDHSLNWQDLGVDPA